MSERVRCMQICAVQYLALTLTKHREAYRRRRHFSIGYLCCRWLPPSPSLLYIEYGKRAMKVTRHNIGILPRALV